MNLLRDRYLDAATRTTLRGVEFQPKGALEGDLGGSRRSTRHGFAVEFAGHREYVPGDDSRHIDWRTFHRSGRLYTKQYQEETNLHVHLLLDLSRSMQYPSTDADKEVTKSLFAARLALALAYVAVAKRDAVSLTPFPQTAPPKIDLGSSMRTLYRMADQIERFKPIESEPSFSDSLESLAKLAASGRLGRRGMIVILSDFLDETDPHLDRLKANLRNLQRRRHELMLFHVLHPDEYDFMSLAKRMNGPKRFRNLERSEELLANPRDLQAEYTKQLVQYLTRIESISRSLGCKYVFARSDTDPGLLVRSAIRSKRQILSHGGGTG